MKKTLIGLMVVGLAACDDTPKPAPKPAAPPPQAAQTTPPAPPKPSVDNTVKPEPAKPDPNKELADRVKRALEGEARIQAAGIDVTAKDGRVTLWGTTTTAAERRRAEAAAKKVEGVSAVDNQLKVVKGS